MRGKETLMRERNIDQLSLVRAPTRDQTCNTGMCPEHKLNQRPFTLQDSAQLIEPHQSGPGSLLINLIGLHKLNTNLLCFSSKHKKARN